MPEYQTQCSCGGSPHTPGCLFQHFLSYSGFWSQPDNIRAMLRKAYMHGLDANPAYRTALELLRNPTPAMLEAMRTGSILKSHPNDSLCRVRLAALAASMETPS